jgi:5-methyltetrahydropteroyltriglutamate--homocysteine methyltransferase
MPATLYRADQVGSLLRPLELLEARARLGPSSPELRELEDAAIRAALERQRAIGIDVLVDGEFRRGAWQTDMAAAVDGFVADNMAMDWHGKDDVIEGSSAQVVGAKLRPRGRLAEHESSFLSANAGGPFKVTLPSPSVFMIMSYKPGVTDRFYPTRKKLLDELTRIVRDEVEALVAEGVPYIQLDAPQYSYYFDDALRETLRSEGVEPDAALADAVAADNSCLDDLGGGTVTTGLHICRGNRRSMWFAQGGYEPIAEKLFATCAANRLLLEYDGDRAGGFEPLRFVPDDTYVVLGLLSSKVGSPEPRDEILRRIDEASRYHSVDRLALSPQCGFASNAAGNALDPQQQWAKLEQVVAIAREVWPD